MLRFIGRPDEGCVIGGTTSHGGPQENLILVGGPFGRPEESAPIAFFLLSEAQDLKAFGG